MLLMFTVWNIMHFVRTRQAGLFLGRAQQLAISVKILTGSSLMASKLVSLHLLYEGHGGGLVVKSVMKKKEPSCHTRLFQTWLSEEGLNIASSFWKSFFGRLLLSREKNFISTTTLTCSRMLWIFYIILLDAVNVHFIQFSRSSFLYRNVSQTVVCIPLELGQ